MTDTGQTDARPGGGAGSGIPTEPPVAGSEADTWFGSLERQRRTLAWKCADLDDAGMSATVGTPTVTLAGLLKHLAFVEDFSFQHRPLGRSPGPPWDAVDWDADPDWEWHSAAGDTPAQLRELWAAAVARSRAAAVELLATGRMDRPGAMTWPDGRTPSVRRTLADLVEEYARHVGHADLIRESVDGLVGEDAPADFRG